MGIWVSFAPIVIGDNSQCISAGSERSYSIRSGIWVGLSGGVNKERDIFVPLKEERKIKSFITCRHTKTILNLWYGRVTHRDPVVIIDNAITIDIFVFDITRHVFTEILSG
ncbi:hypothetical protein D3C73_955470 [compost metagenome]